jgi:hypothetical protein
MPKCEPLKVADVSSGHLGICLELTQLNLLEAHTASPTTLKEHGCRACSWVVHDAASQVQGTSSRAAHMSAPCRLAVRRYTQGHTRTAACMHWQKIVVVCSVQLKDCKAGTAVAAGNTATTDTAQLPQLGLPLQRSSVNIPWPACCRPVCCVQHMHDSIRIMHA